MAKCRLRLAIHAWGGEWPAGGVKIDYRPVHNFTLTSDIEYIKPNARAH
jgi:succinate dehydrogenase flavoprotein subunit